EFHAISSASGEGIPELVRAMADALDRIPKPAASSPSSASADAAPPAADPSEAAPLREER
ncbi:MAG: hypothetical protein ACRD5R_08815, partial [Candidatus Acidiferrales bacterium]